MADAKEVLEEWVNDLERILELGELVLTTPWQPARLEVNAVPVTEPSPILRYLREREERFQVLTDREAPWPGSHKYADARSSTLQPDELSSQQEMRIRKLMEQVVEQNHQLKRCLHRNLDTIRAAQNHLLFTQRMKSPIDSPFAPRGLAINRQG